MPGLNRVRFALAGLEISSPNLNISTQAGSEFSADLALSQSASGQMPPSPDVVSVGSAVFRIARILGTEAGIQLDWDIRRPPPLSQIALATLYSLAIDLGQPDLFIQCSEFPLPERWEIAVSTAPATNETPRAMLQVIDVLHKIDSSMRERVDSADIQEIEIKHGQQGVEWVAGAEAAKTARIIRQHLLPNNSEARLQKIDFLVAKDCYKWAGIVKPRGNRRGPQYRILKVTC